MSKSIARLFLSLFAVVCAGSASPVSLQATSAAGGSFNLDIDISVGTADIAGFLFSLGFDSTVLQVTGVTEGAFLPTGGNLTFFDPGTIGPGTVSNVNDVTSGNPSTATSGTLAVISFTVVNPNVANTTITISNVQIIDDNGNFVYYNPNTDSSTTLQFAPEPATVLLIGISALALWRRSLYISSKSKPTTNIETEPEALAP